jgi:hypothetical protein
MKKKSSDQPTLGNTVLATINVILLVCGLAPIGLFQIARSNGISTSKIGSLPLAAPFLGLAVVLILIMSICSIFRSDMAIRVGLWSIFGIAVLNLGGCASMWSDLRGVH